MSVLAFCAVAWLSLAPKPLPNRDLQKLLHPYEHLLMFAVFAVICFFVWPGRPRLVLIALVTIAALMEIMQILLPVRAFELDDLAMNLAGVGLGAMVFWGTRQVKIRR